MTSLSTHIFDKQLFVMYGGHVVPIKNHFHSMISDATAKCYKHAYFKELRFVDM